MLKIEAEFISAFSVRSRGGFLTNRVRLNPENINRYIKINIPDGCYEKAQMVLMLMKSAAMELAKANPHGISNSDAAKYLGLQSDYSGGSNRPLKKPLSRVKFDAPPHFINYARN